VPLTFEQAYEQRDSYRPTDPEALSRLSEVDLLEFVGASGVGKDFNMYETGGHIVTSGTTRDPRPGESGMAHYSLDEALQLIEQGKVVQYAAIKEFNNIYFTLPEYFQPGLNVKDVTHDATHTFENRGLRRVRRVGVLAMPDEYSKRIAERVQGMTQRETLGRLAHAAITTSAILEWCLNDEALVIVSTERRNTDNKLAIRQFAETGEVNQRDNEAALVIGTKMLHTIHRLEAYFRAQDSNDATRLLV
jgi:guanylate kinase